MSRSEDDQAESLRLEAIEAAKRNRIDKRITDLAARNEVLEPKERRLAASEKSVAVRLLAPCSLLLAH